MVVMAHDKVLHDLTRGWVNLGLIPPNTRRVIIDIPVDEAARLYTESFADERMFTDDLTSVLQDAKRIESAPTCPNDVNKPITRPQGGMGYQPKGPKIDRHNLTPPTGGSVVQPPGPRYIHVNHDKPKGPPPTMWQ